MSGIRYGSNRNRGRLRRRLLFGMGLALLIAGVAVLTIGLISYFDDGEDSSDPTVVAPPLSLNEIEGLPDAIPYYNPKRTGGDTETEPEPVTAPLRLVIESIGVDGPIVEMGLDANSYPQVPNNGQDIAWYSDFSSKPGDGRNAVFAGHINWAQAPGVFSELDEVQAGDLVRLVSKDGREYVYEAFAVFPVDPEDPASLKVMAPTPTDTITLITCGGTWIPDPSEQFGGNYTTRTIVQGKLVASNVSATAPDASS
jgi:LPXTG-site transpeptidase (sortase) family protein